VYKRQDGLTDSNTGTATISISRNFRAPETFDETLNINEDQAINFVLAADDPDGILGVDFNGLDTLTYQIVEAPQNGSITGSGANRTYTPDADFNGTDSLVFQVNDGLFDSNQATVTFNIAAVNDIPTVQFTDGSSRLLPRELWPLLEGKIAGNNVQAGLGYPLPMMAEYVDPDAGQKHFLQISWGDGSSDSANQNPPGDPENPPDEPVITTTFRSLGQIFADHTYLSTGLRTIGVTVIDEDGGTSATAQTTIEVIPMVDVTLKSDPVDEENLAEPGQITELTIYVSNEPPSDPIVGLNATNVEFTGELPDGVQFINIQTSQGNCSQMGPTSTCQLGTLLPEDVVTITVTMLPDANFDPSASGYVITATSTEPYTTVHNLSVLSIPVPLHAAITAYLFG